MFFCVVVKILKRKKYKIKNKKITEVVLVHCNVVNNDYQHSSRVLYRFVPNKSIVPLFHILANSFIFLKIFNSEFSCIKVRFTDHNSKLLEIEDKINMK